MVVKGLHAIFMSESVVTWTTKYAYHVAIPQCKGAHVPYPSCEAVSSCRVVKWHPYLLYLRIKRIALWQRDGTSYLLPRARPRLVPVVQRAGDLLPTSHVRDRKPSDSTLSWSDETINLTHHKCSVSVQGHFTKNGHKLVSVIIHRTLGEASPYPDGHGVARLRIRKE
jgi:hypothetical protein